MNRFFTLGFFFLFVAVIAESAPQTKVESKATKIARALSAAPANIANSANVVDLDEKGKETVLREGTNGFTCFPGHLGVIGDNPVCKNAPAMQWEQDFAQHKPKPTNTEPGIEYMLAGGTDWSASDPTATSGNPIKEPPHWMMMWPFDPTTTGLPTTAKQTGTWIMWAGTPWAHLMINQRP
jgi:hypothetical protein